MNYSFDKAKGLDTEIENLRLRNQILGEAQSSEIQKHSDKHEISLKEFIINGIERNKLAFMIYGVNRKKGEDIGYSEDEPLDRIHTLEKPNNAPCVDCVKKGQNLKSFFLPEVSKTTSLNNSKNNTNVLFRHLISI